MTEWLQGTIRGVKAPQLEDIRTDMEGMFLKMWMILNPLMWKIVTS